VITLLDDRTFLHDDDSVRGFHGGQAVRDHDAGCVFEDEVQCLLDLPLGERVNSLYMTVKN